MSRIILNNISDPKGFVNNQINYREVISCKIHNNIFIWFKPEICNWFISHFISLKSVVFGVFAPTGTFKDMVSTISMKTLDDHARRFLDIIGAIIGLVLSSALFLILSILIKLDSKGPVIYTQLRVGKNRRRADRRRIAIDISKDRRNWDRRKVASYGKPFVIYKFRTMWDDAEKKCGPVLASDNDPRITLIGRILRYTHLDELPQLINILKGDMSFVGPKPERPYFVNQLAIQIPGYIERFNVRPGLTGLAQLKTDYDYSLEGVKKKLYYDLEYYKNSNLKSYFKIIFKSMAKSVGRRKYM